MVVIETNDLTKVFQIPHKEPGLAGAVKALFVPKYDQKTAVDRVNFQIAEGEIVGYIGVNGAGKSTTIKMLTGILVPTSGRACVLGAIRTGSGSPMRATSASFSDNGRSFGGTWRLSNR